VAVLPPMTYRDMELPMGPVPALGERNCAILAELGFLDDVPCECRTASVTET
jgi:hypothetical protein